MVNILLVVITSAVFRTLIEDAVSAEVGDLTVYSAGLPGSGPVLCLMLNILDGL